MLKNHPGIYKIIGVFVLLYMFFIVGKTSYQNYQINNKIKALKSDVESLEIENKNLTQDIEYFKTDTYKEKVARQRLGLKKPDENVMVIVPSEESEDNEVEEEKLSNPEKWWKFFFRSSES